MTKRAVSARKPADSRPVPVRGAPRLDDVRAPHVATSAVVERQGHDVAKLLYAAFGEYNAAHFGGKLGSPLVLITQAQSARTNGDYIARDVMGLESRIRIAPRTVKRGERFVLDVLLHEMVHAWQEEVEGDGEPGYRGHGPRFAFMCNRIGEALGLPPVGVKGRGGVPDCAYWPLNVRPEGYYPEPFEAPKRKAKAKDDAGDGGESDDDQGEQPDALATIRRLLGRLEADELEELRDIIDAELSGRD